MKIFNVIISWTPWKAHANSFASLTFYLMVVWSLFKAEAAVAAWPSTRFVQVDKYLGVPKRSSSAIANSFPPMHNTDRLIVNHLHCAQWAWLELENSLLKTWT